MSPTSENGAKGSMDYCGKCAGMHPLNKFEDASGIRQRDCYIWQIVSNVTHTLRYNDNNRDRIADGEALARSKLKTYREGMQRRNPTLNLDSLYIESTVVRMVKEALKNQPTPEYRLSKTTDSLPQNSPSTIHDPVIPPIDTTRRQGSQTSPSVSSPEAFESTTNPIRLSDGGPSKTPSLGPIDAAISHLSQDKSGPANGLEKSSEERVLTMTPTTVTMASDNIVRNSHGGESNKLPRDHSHTVEQSRSEGRPLPPPFYPTRRCGTCSMEKHNAHFWSHKKRDEEVLDCMFCRVKHRIQHFFKTKIAGRTEDEREAVVKDAKAAATEFIESWKNFVIFKDVWSRGELDGLFDSVNDSIDYTVVAISQEFPLSPPRKKYNRQPKLLNSNSKRKADALYRRGEGVFGPERLTKVAKTPKKVLGDAKHAKPLSGAAKQFKYITVDSGDEEEMPQAKVPGAISPKSQETEAPQSNLRDSESIEESVIKCHFKPIRERTREVQRLLDKIEAFDPAVHAKAGLTEKSIKSRDDMLEKLDGMIKSLKTRIQVYEWDDSY